MFYFLFFIFLIVRRPWPNFVCKGRHTSSVVLVLVLYICNIYRDVPRGVGYPADARSVGDSHRSCLPSSTKLQVHA